MFMDCIFDLGLCAKTCRNFRLNITTPIIIKVICFDLKIQCFGVLVIILVYMSLEEYIDAQLTLIGWNHLFSFCLSSVLQHSVAFCSLCGVFSF